MNFFSRGKLLLSGEYLVLRGALSLAVPLKLGQTLKVTESPNKGFLSWESYEKERLWFSATFETPGMSVTETSDKIIADRLRQILVAVQQLVRGFFQTQSGKLVKIYSDFNLNWGLGSSSALISNIAAWAGANPYELHKLISNGSGYDVVCSREEGPIFFQRTGEYYKKQKVDFNPVFRDKIFFIYLGRKQDSAASVEAFTGGIEEPEKESALISKLGYKMAEASELGEFEQAVKDHEKVMASILNKKPLMETRFRDFEGTVKSLGAWGGDFAMVTWKKSGSELLNYLNSKNIDLVFTFDQLIKTW
jgi:mevalonate kinase